MAGRARPRLRVLHRRVLSLVAHDITKTTTTRSAVVVVPHADDETIGCGATIARKRAAGTPTHVVIAADGEHPERQAEALEACRRLGLGADDVTFLGLPDGSLGSHPHELDDALGALVDRYEPDELFAPTRVDAHPDHRALAEAIARVRSARGNATPLLTFPVWFWNRWAWTDPRARRSVQRAQLAWRPLAFTASTRVGTVRIDPFRDVKRHALDAHHSQVAAEAQTAGGQALDPAWLQLFLGRDEVFFLNGRSGKAV